MAKKVYKATLSKRGIDSLIKNIKNYRDSLNDKTYLLAQRLAEKGVDVAQVRLGTYNAIFTGDLIRNIFSTGGKVGKTAVFYIIADSKHAAFVEFGTGQLGMEGGYPHPFPEGVEWNYNSGEKIFEFEPGQYGWFYIGNDGKLYFTQGMPSRPFMYETSLRLPELVVSIAREVFR